MIPKFNQIVGLIMASIGAGIFIGTHTDVSKLFLTIFSLFFMIFGLMLLNKIIFNKK